MNDPEADLIHINKRETLSESWFKLEKVTFEQTRKSGARQTLEREVYHNGPGAAVLPVDLARGTVLLVRQLRIPAYLNGDTPMVIELCAGVVEAGDTPAQTVCKEAEQEMGYRLRNPRQRFELYMSPGSSAEKLYLFDADYTAADHTGRGGGLLAEGEQIEVLEMPLVRALEMALAGKINDAKTVLMLQYARLAGAQGGKEQP